MDELYQQIIDSYKETGSVKKTAEELVISEKNVQSYMPYSRGQYGGEDRNNETIRSEEYRGRMQQAAKNQVTNTEAHSKKKEDDIQEQQRLLEELRAEKERLLKEKKEFWDMIEAETKRIPMAVQLHLELDLGYFADEHMEVLRRYGRMKDGITRDFIVPGNMTLHGLHYAIMKAFGWQNSHLHSYVPYEDEFKKMTDGGLVKEWTRQVGMYFRFPSENYEDLYWDDDYEEGESFKNWLKSKYCGPYSYEGVGEHYIPAQIEVDRFRKDWPAIQKKTTDQRTWNVYMEGQCEEMLERPMLWTVLKTPAEQGDWDSWKQEKEVALKQVEEKRKDIIKKYRQLTARMDQIVEEAGTHFDEEGNPTIDMVPYFREMEELDLELERLCIDYNPEPIPALSALCYRYDYGDGWKIKITCINAWYDKTVYARDEEGNMLHDKNGFVPEKALFVDAFGQQIDGEFLDKLRDIQHKEKPICIAWDGMNLVDDVGGVGGFCEFLEAINGDDPKEKKSYKIWARSQGWTGRMPKPENML